MDRGDEHGACEAPAGRAGGFNQRDSWMVAFSWAKPYFRIAYKQTSAYITRLTPEMVNWREVSDESYAENRDVRILA